MFTVKHIDSRGNEELFQAEKLLHIPDDGSREAFGSAGLYFDPQDEPGSSAASLDGTIAPQHPSRYSRCIAYSKTGAPDTPRPRVFVMNREGATVATYRL